MVGKPFRIEPMARRGNLNFHERAAAYCWPLALVMGCCALIIGCCAVAGAQSMPKNPLRSGETVTLTQPAAQLQTTAQPRPKSAAGESVLTNRADDVWEQRDSAAVQQVQLVEGFALPEPQSVVPPNLGQPPPTSQPWQTQPYLMEDCPAGNSYDPLNPNGGQNRTWIQPFFGHTDPNDPGRHVGLGQPLVGTSWLNRPVYFGLFVGGLLYDDLIDGRVMTSNSAMTGVVLGFDFDHYWGIEGRFGYSRVHLTNGLGVPLDDSHNSWSDLSLMYYPWGDSRWRPYFSAGLGFATFRFHDDFGRDVNDTLFSLPLGVGMKYYYTNNFTLRVGWNDNLSFGDNTLDTMNNFSLFVGGEYRFGGRSPSYFPWHGNTTIW
jgi:opacity protein-like surface antigen